MNKTNNKNEEREREEGKDIQGNRKSETFLLFACHLETKVYSSFQPSGKPRVVILPPSGNYNMNCPFPRGLSGFPVILHQTSLYPNALNNKSHLLAATHSDQKLRVPGNCQKFPKRIYSETLNF